MVRVWATGSLLQPIETRFFVDEACCVSGIERSEKYEPRSFTGGGGAIRAGVDKTADEKNSYDVGACAKKKHSRYHSISILNQSSPYTSLDSL